MKRVSVIQCALLKRFYLVVTIKNLVESKVTIQEAIKNKDIDYKGVGFVKRTKFGLAKTIGKIFF